MGFQFFRSVIAEVHFPRIIEPAVAITLLCENYFVIRVRWFFAFNRLVVFPVIYLVILLIKWISSYMVFLILFQMRCSWVLFGLHRLWWQILFQSLLVDHTKSLLVYSEMIFSKSPFMSKGILQVYICIFTCALHYRIRCYIL